MKTDFEHWLSAQFGETGPFTLFIVLVRIAGDEVVPLKSSYAHLIGDDMDWREMQRPARPRRCFMGRRGVLRRAWAMPEGRCPMPRRRASLAKSRPT